MTKKRPTKIKVLWKTLWRVMSQRYLTIRRGDKRLSVSVTQVDGKEFLALAIEHNDGSKKSSSDAVDDVLEHHAHKNLGTFKSERAATLRAQTFVMTWLRSTKSVEQCECEEIGAKPKKTKKKR